MRCAFGFDLFESSRWYLINFLFNVKKWRSIPGDEVGIFDTKVQSVSIISELYHTIGSHFKY